MRGWGESERVEEQEGGEEDGAGDGEEGEDEVLSEVCCLSLHHLGLSVNCKYKTNILILLKKNVYLSQISNTFEFSL